jgi:hypothetical protein
LGKQKVGQTLKNALKSLSELLNILFHLFLAMHKIDTPKGNEKYLSTRGSIEKIASRQKLSIGKFILFSDSTFNLKMCINRLPIRIGRKRKKLK